MIKTKKKYLIISLLTVIFAAVICAFTIQPSQAVHAADSTHAFNYCAPVVTYDTVVETDNGVSSEKIKISMVKDICYKDVQSVSSKSLYFLMYTTDLSKYLALKAGALLSTTQRSTLLLVKEDEYLNSDTMKYLKLTDFLYKVVEYCDDGKYYTKNVKFSDEENVDYAFKTKLLSYVLGSSYGECAGSRAVFASFNLPTDLDKTYYFYSVQMELSKSYTVVNASSSVVSLGEAINVVSISPYYKVDSIKKDLLGELEKDTLSDDRRALYQKALGIYTGSKAMPITVKYKYCAGYGDIREAEKSFTMDSLYGQCKSKAVEAMYNRVEGLNGITSFNCVYEDFKWLSNGDQLDFGDKVILQAKDFTYVYNGSESAVLTVNYEPFNYKDFSIRVTNNDEANNLTLDICSASVIEDSVNYTLKFNYADMNRWLANKAGWLVDLNNDLFNSDGVIVNKSNKVEVTVGDTELLIKVAKAEQNSLADLRVCVVAEIVEDKNITYTVHYTKLVVDVNGEITQEDVAMSPTLCLMTVYQQLTNFTNFMNRFGDTVSSAVAPVGLGSVVYYVPSSVSSVSIGELEYNLNVAYTYRTILRVSENSVFKRFVQLDHYNNQYSLSDLGVVVPDGYRVSNMTSDSFMSIDFDDKAPDKAILTSNVDLFTNKIVDVDVEFSDTILVNLDYLENYVYTDENGNQQASGFAVKKTLYKEVSADFFADVYKPTLDELKAYTGLDNMCIIGTFGAVNTDKISVVKNGAVYNVKVEYHEAFLKVTQSTGESEFMNIPLSNYADWCKSFDKDWSILALNTKEKVCFTSNADVGCEDLFGYFYVAIFKELVKNFDELFAGYSADGCRSFYTAKKVQGTDLYKFCDSMGIIGAIITCGGSKVYQAVEESFSEDAGTYFSYFMYIDGSSTLNYASNNKADDYFDNESAFENTAKDVQETISTWWNSNNGIVKGIKAVLGVLLIVGVAICVIYLIPVFAGGIGKASKAITQVKNDTKNKGGTTYKKPVKKYKSHKTKRK